MFGPELLVCSPANREHRFVDCEKWRADFNLDELVRTFEYTEKPEVFKYYPQYYHKTDKVRTSAPDRRAVY
jgi:hypothetical protein